MAAPPAPAGEEAASPPVPAVPQYTLTYTAGKNGSITGVSPQQVDQGSDGSPVTAVADKGFHFAEWSDGLATAGRTDRNVSADLAVNARFAVNQYTLTYTAGENGTIEGTSPQSVAHGGNAGQVSAVADKGYHFVAWSDGLTTPSRTDTGVTGDLAVKAAFAISTYPVGGTVAGLAAGNEVVLQNNGGDTLTVAANGPFTFPTPLPHGRGYTATVLTQPTAPNQSCTVSNGAGTVAAADVGDLRVECKFIPYTVGGTVAGLPEGGQLVLRNKGEELTVKANGKFTFAKALNDGSAYEVTLHSQRLKPRWTCAVGNGAGTLAGKDITTVEIVCFPD